MSNEGERRGLGRTVGVIGLVAIVAILGFGAVGQAGWFYSPPVVLTQWVAGVGNWFVATNWDTGVPTASGTARVDNGGQPVISTSGAVAGTLQLGFSATGSGGNLDLEPGATLVVKSGEFVGLQGFGSVLQNGGGNAITAGQLDLGYSVTGNGAYLMETGSLTAFGGEIIGDQGSGAFLQINGANAITSGDLVVASGSISDGAYELDAGSLVVNGDEVIGQSGLGSFEQNGGINVVNSSCQQSNCNNYFNQCGSNNNNCWTLTNGNGCGVGQNDNNCNHLGDFCQSFHSTCPNQNSGSTPPFVCGFHNQSGSCGQYSINNCGSQKQCSGHSKFCDTVGQHHCGNFSQYLNCSSQKQCGQSGCGQSFNWGGCGSSSWGCQSQTVCNQNQCACGGLTLGFAEESEGDYFMDGGLLTVNGNEVVGNNGFGFFLQSNGQQSITNNLILGENSLGNGAYFLQGGTVTVSQNAYIGGIGQGQCGSQNQWCSQTYNQCSYQNQWGCSQYFNCGYQTYNQCGSQCSDQCQNLGGIGFYDQTGGTFTDSGTVYVGGNQQGSVCLMDLQGGSFIAGGLQVGTLGGSGALQITSSTVFVEVLTGGFTLGQAASMTIPNGAGVHFVGGSFVNNSTNEIALADLSNLTLYFDGSTGGTLEVAGANLGAVAAGFTGNFALGSLIVGSTSPAKVTLVDNVNNGNRGTHNTAEALYVQNVTVAAGSTLNLNGLKLYYHGTLSNLGTITGGTPVLVP